MADFDNTNRGAIWKSVDKKTDKHPDFTGNINVDGKEYWLNAWKQDPKKSNEKSPILSFSVKLKDDTQSSAPTSGGSDNDIPF